MLGVFGENLGAYFLWRFDTNNKAPVWRFDTNNKAPVWRFDKNKKALPKKRRFIKKEIRLSRGR